MKTERWNVFLSRLKAALTGALPALPALRPQEAMSAARASRGMFFRSFA